MNNKKFTKRDIINFLNIKSGFPKSLCKKLINDIIELIINNINNEGGLKLKNLGTFYKVFKKERVGRNPKTKIEYKISSRNSIRFVPSKNLK